MATKNTKKKTSGQKNKSAKNAKGRNAKITEAQLAEKEKSRGVAVMLLGLIFALWFIVAFVTNLVGDLDIGSKFLQVLSFICNLGIALLLVYRGFALFVQKKMRISGWQLVGWLGLCFAVAAMLHLPKCGNGFSLDELGHAFSSACFGFGGGICGFILGYPVHFIPSVKVQYVLLGAFAILGIMLGSDMKIVDKIVNIFDNDPEKVAERQAKRDAKAAERAARKAEKEERENEKLEREFRAAQLKAMKREAAKAGKKPAAETVAEEENANAAISPVITDYRSKTAEDHVLGAIDVDNLDRDAVYVGREFKDLAGLDDYDAAAVNEVAEDEHTYYDDRAAEITDEEEMPRLAQEEALADDYALPPEPVVEPLPKKVAGTAKSAVVAKAVAGRKPETTAGGQVADLPSETTTTQKPLAAAEPVVRQVPYTLPPVSLLTGGPAGPAGDTEKMHEDSKVLESVLASFGVKANVVEVVCGPAIVRYELQPAPGVKVSKIVNLQDDIALALAAKGLRIEAPVPGKSVIGIEVAKPEVSAVYFKDVVGSKRFQDNKSKLAVAFGIDINGNPVVGDLASMPHLLIAGATGSGKSVCMNTLICSLLYKAKPDEVKIIMIDPKKVELAGYNGLPHLARPVVTDPKKAALVLKEVVNEMDRRYTIFTSCGVKNFKTYNEIAGEENRLPQIVVLIDELADLMMVASRDVEGHIVRLTQLARAAGIHLVIATQRPSVDVITGLIKANIPSRIAFAVSSMVDSRTILDMGGAEKLLGKGDMLYHPVGLAKPIRVQGAFLSEDEIDKLVAFCSQQAVQEFLEFPADEDETESEEGAEGQFEDELFVDACQVIFDSGRVSASYLQRRFSIGYNRAARLIEDMEEMGIISPPKGNKRELLMNEEEFYSRYLGGGDSEYPTDDDMEC